MYLGLPAASEHAGLVVVLGEGGDEAEQLLHRLDRLGVLLSPACRELEVRRQEGEEHRIIIRSLLSDQ